MTSTIPQEIAPALSSDAQEVLYQALIEIRRLAATNHATALPQIWQLATTASDVLSAEGLDPDPSLVASQPIQQLKHRLTTTATAIPSTSEKPKKENLMNIRHQNLPRIALFVAVSGLLGANLWQSSQTQSAVAHIQTSVDGIAAAFKSAQGQNTPLTAQEISEILKRSDDDCAKSYVQKSLAAGQVVLRGQVVAGSGSDACRMAAALTEQRQATAQ